MTAPDDDVKSIHPYPADVTDVQILLDIAGQMQYGVMSLSAMWSRSRLSDMLSELYGEIAVLQGEVMRTARREGDQPEETL